MSHVIAKVHTEDVPHKCPSCGFSWNTCREVPSLIKLRYSKKWGATIRLPQYSLGLWRSGTQHCLVCIIFCNFATLDANHMWEHLIPAVFSCYLCRKNLTLLLHVHKHCTYEHCDTWHVTHDTWHVTSCGGLTFSKNFSSLALTVCDLWYYKDLEEKDRWHKYKFDRVTWERLQKVFV